MPFDTVALPGILRVHSITIVRFEKDGRPFHGLVCSNPFALCKDSETPIHILDPADFRLKRNSVAIETALLQTVDKVHEKLLPAIRYLRTIERMGCGNDKSFVEMYGKYQAIGYVSRFLYVQALKKEIAKQVEAELQQVIIFKPT